MEDTPVACPYHTIPPSPTHHTASDKQDQTFWKKFLNNILVSKVKKISLKMGTVQENYVRSYQLTVPEIWDTKSVTTGTQLYTRPPPPTLTIISYRFIFKIPQTLSHYIPSAAAVMCTSSDGKIEQHIVSIIICKYYREMSDTARDWII